MNPLIAPDAARRPPRPRPRCRSTSTRSRCCATRAHLGIPSVRARRDAVPARPAPTASPCTRGPTNATSAPHDVHELAALLQALAAGRVQHRRQPVPQPDGLRARARGPQQCTFVPDSDEQSTSDHGWDLAADGARLRAADRRGACARRARQPVHGPAARGDGAAREVGADRVELYTEPYAARMARRARPRVLARFAAAAAGGAGARAWASTPATT